MQAILVKDNLEVARTADPEIYKNQSELREVKKNGRMMKVRFWLKGARIPGPESHLLVRNGAAIPGDEECRLAAGMTETQMKAAQLAHDSLTSFIEVRHKPLFELGLITGYDFEKDLFKLGPHAAEASDFRDQFTKDDWEKFQRSLKEMNDAIDSSPTGSSTHSILDS